MSNLGFAKILWDVRINPALKLAKTYITCGSFGLKSSAFNKIRQIDFGADCYGLVDVLVMRLFIFQPGKVIVNILCKDVGPGGSF